MSTLDHSELNRFQSQIMLKQVGLSGQRKLKACSILLIGTASQTEALKTCLLNSGISNVALIQDTDLATHHDLDRYTLWLAIQPDPEVARQLNRVALNLKKPFWLLNFGATSLNLLQLYPGVGPCIDCISDADIHSFHSIESKTGALSALPVAARSLVTIQIQRYILGNRDFDMDQLIKFDVYELSIQKFVINRSLNCETCQSGEVRSSTNTTDKRQTGVESPLTLQTRKENSTTSISVAELDKLMQIKPQPILIDVRESYELDINRIPQAIHISLPEIKSGKAVEKFKQISESGQIILYCKSGIRSQQALECLPEEIRNRACSLEGGIDAYIDIINPDLDRY